MKKIQRYFVALLAAQMLLVVSCKQEEIPTLDAGAIPEASTYDSNIKISIDPATNQVTFALEGAQGVYPIWIFDGTTYSTTNGLQKIYAVAGDYTVDVKIGNANGISDGVIPKTFHIDNTIMDFTKYYTLLCKDGKKWHIDGETAGHMGCGEPGTTGNGWWSAPVNDKKDWGVYDNILTFTHGDEGNTYTFDPGESGTVYVNKDVTVWPDLRNPDADFNVPAQLQTVNYELVVEGNDLYIVFPEHTFFPYIANNDIWETPRYRIESITAKQLDLVIDNGSIAWHYILSSGEVKNDNPDVPEEGAHYDIAGSTNLWRNSGEVGVTFWYSPADWSGGLTPEFEWQGYDFRVVMPEGIGGSEWQGQTHFTINAPVYADKLYDFCATLNSAADCVCTVKLAWEGNDGENFFFYKNDVQLKAFEDVPFKMPKIAPNVDYDKVALFFDFGRTPAGTEVVVKDICLQEHQEPNGGGNNDSEGENLWPAATVNYGFWYANSGWGQIGDPQWEPLAGNGIRVVIPEGIGGSEWQGQTQFHTNIPASADKTYNFSMDVDADADMVITVKLAWEGNDNDHAFFYVNDFKVNAYETATFTMKGVAPDVDYDACVLFVDLGRSPAGSTVELKNIKLAEAGGGAAPTPQGTQIWNPEKVTFTYWYSAGDWTGQLAPGIMWDPSKESVVLTMPEGIGGSEWQGQSHFTLDAPVYAAKKYDFGITINSSADCVCTVKLAWEGNDNENFFFYKNDVQLSAYEDVRFEQLGIAPNVDYDKVALFVDLGRTPAGSEVTISGFSLIEY